MRRYKPQERKKIIKAFLRSGMTQRAFAKDHGVNVHTLQHWLHSDEKATAHFVEVKTGQDGITLRVAGVELALAELPPPEYVAELARSVGA